MKRDKKDTEFATEELIKQSNSKNTKERDGHTVTPRPQSKTDLLINEKKSKSTTL